MVGVSAAHFERHTRCSCLFRSEMHAPKAVQFLTLGGGGVGRAFTLQRDGVLHVEEIVMNALNEEFMGEVGRNGSINLRRRVFTRVSYRLLA